MDIVEKAEKILEGKSDVMLASINEKGYPRICTVSKSRSDGICKIWVSTNINSSKVRHFKNNPKSSICFDDGANGVSLTGKVALKQDLETKKEFWLDWFINYYPGGVTDPDYCILEFTTEEATLFIDNELITLSVNYKY